MKNLRDMKVKDYMSYQVVKIDIDATIHDAVDRMLECNIHGLIVTENDRPVGVITANDLLPLMDKGESGTDSLVSQFMSRGLLSVAPEDGLDKAVSIMTAHKTHRLAVVTRDKRVLGVVTTTDLMKMFQKARKQKNECI